MLALALAASAGAQVPGDAVKLSPSTAGKGSHVLVDLRVSEDPKAGGRSPQGVAIALATGFKYDGRARSERCSPERAKGFDCPANSKIGSGTANVTVSSGVFSGPATVEVQFFLAPPVQSGDAAGIVMHLREPSSGQQGTTTGRIARTSGTYGLEVRFDDLQSANPDPNFNVRVDRIQADVGASRTEKVKVCCKTVRRNGKKVRVRYYKKFRRDLLRNPTSCSGSWPWQVRLRYAPGEESVRDGSAACSAAARR